MQSFELHPHIDAHDVALSSTRRADGMPCTISSSIEVQSVLGKPYSPLNDGVGTA